MPGLGNALAPLGGGPVAGALLTPTVTNTMMRSISTHFL